jgi:stage V sporulation protein D (sporulation-specific penicillin-binding protein)
VSSKNVNARLYLIFIAFALVFFFLLARLVFVQIFNAPQLKDIARAQHSSFSEVEPQRGDIFDRNLKPLALNSISYSIFASAEFTPTEKEKRKMLALLSLDKDYLDRKIIEQKSFVWLARKINPDISARLKGLEINGLGQIREYKRLYPNGSLAAHLLGFTDIDNRGLEGIELYTDAYLSGMKGWRLTQRDAKRRELICWGYKSILPTDGYDIVLTIDSVIQNIVERHLRLTAERYKALSATAIVMQPASGEILALYNYPDYDLNNLADYSAAWRRNLAVTDVFEPGSSFKFITAASALEEEKVKLEDRFFCENGQYRVGGRILHDHKPHAELSFKEVIEHSSNIGTAKVAQLLGKNTLYRYIKDFGFGSPTEIDLPGEVKGIVHPPSRWSRTSLSSVPMGQEIAVTPIQLIRAVSCVANDGMLVKPQIIKLIQRKDKKVIKSFPAQEVRRVISAQTARALKDILAGVVENGTGKLAAVPGYRAAGKTGTAQKARPTGGYYRNKYIASFAGFVPADQPVISILVVVNEPRPIYFGSQVAAPVFRKIATETLRYLQMSNEIKATD